ncbi:MAG: 50S ribosomal protein L10 [Myxococcota bacterium]|jgi:large subunit ribosomal protein L10|nr:50S ribosomal protein L10 [Myxococcota bacterium]
MDRAQKTQEINELRERFDRMASAVVTDFRGMDVETLNSLRNKFREASVEYKVVKNTLVKKALADKDFIGKLDGFLHGPSAVAWSYEDPAAAAKVAIKFVKDHKKLALKCAIVDGKVLDERGVESLSKLPGKNELRGKLLATFLAPATEFVRLMAAAPTNFLYVMQARKRNLEEQ